MAITINLNRNKEFNDLLQGATVTLTIGDAEVPALTTDPIPVYLSISGGPHGGVLHSIADMHIADFAQATVSAELTPDP